MKVKFVFAVVFGLFLLHPLSNVRSEEVSIETVPPVVVQTVPQSGTMDVDPKVSEIKVSFSKDMMDQGWSWIMVSKETFPEMEGEPKYMKDKRTCVLQVRLLPGKTYAIWINSNKFNNFKDTQGRSAVPYLLVFKTKK